MKLEVTPKAQQWFKEETGVQPETGIRFFGKIYGKHLFMMVFPLRCL